MSNRRRPIVFVDPQDPQVLYWWPAIVLLAQDMLAFYDYTNGDYDPPQEGEMTVCYLEDGSFSNVVEKDTVPFDLNGPPYTDYTTSDGLNEKGIVAAKLYMDKGILPSSLSWLDKRKSTGKKRKKESKLDEKVESNLVIPVKSKVLDPISKKRLAVEMHQLKTLNVE